MKAQDLGMLQPNSEERQEDEYSELGMQSVQFNQEPKFKVKVPAINLLVTGKNYSLKR